MGLPVLRGNFDDVYDLRFTAQNILTDTIPTFPLVSQRIFDVQESVLKEEKVSGIAGYEDMDSIGENEDFPIATPVQLYDKTYTHGYYANKIVISLLTRQDDPKGIFSSTDRQVQFHVKAALNTVEKHAASVLINGWTSTSCPDGQYLIDDAHPQSPDVTGTTYDNALGTTVLDNAGAAVNSMIAHIANNHFDAAGHPVLVPKWLLVVPPALEYNAHSSVKALYGSSGNVYSAPSPISEGLMTHAQNIEVVCWPYLSAAMGGSDTAWYFIADPANFKGTHSLRWYWRVRPTYTIDGVEPSVDKDNGAWEVPFVTRFVAGCHDWRHVFGSTGTG